MKTAIILSAFFSLFTIASCKSNSANTADRPIEEAVASINDSTNGDSTATLYFAGGCFWGTEHFFKQIYGVIKTEAGYANGHTDNPTYEDVSWKNTGYAETVKVTYDKNKLDLNLLLDLYFLTIDPTSLNKQGNDVGDQYRTGIYYTSKEQIPIIEQRLATEANKYAKPLVVEVKPIERFYKAEEYHQDYLDKNPGGYCHINPALFDFAKKANQPAKN